MRNNLTSILVEVYTPGFKLEDFMAPTLDAPDKNQLLHERDYTCKDCGSTFSSAEDFSNHFLRLVGEEGGPTIVIIGCSKPN